MKVYIVTVRGSKYGEYIGDWVFRDLANAKAKINEIDNEYVFEGDPVAKLSIWEMPDDTPCDDLFWDFEKEAE